MNIERIFQKDSRIVRVVGLLIILSLIITTGVFAITRTYVKTRALVWINAQVPYSQSAYRDGYRTDCSGFVSYAWNLKNSSGYPVSLTTYTLPNVSYPITKDELQTGDILLNSSSHVLMFDTWANSEKTYYWALEMTPPKAVFRMVPYPYWSGYGTFLPYRYREIAASDTDDGRTLSSGQTLYGSISPSYDRDEYFYNGTSGANITIQLNKYNSNLDPYLELWLNGRIIGQDDDRGGNYNSLLSVTLPENGTYRIIAKDYGSSIGAYSILLTQGASHDPDDYRWIAFNQQLYGTINPTTDQDIYYFSGISGRVVSIRMTKTLNLDSFLELWAPNGSRIAYNDDGAGNLNSWLVATLPSSGVYRIVAKSYGGGTSGGYYINLGQSVPTNLALNKSSYASSVEYSGLEPSKAFDGYLGSRWSSRFVDPGWIWVDLGQSVTFNQVVLRWESAFARTYGIYVWNGSTWVNKYWTTYGNGGVDTITIPAITGQYVMMYATQRGTPWGYSLYEFEVYNSANTVVPVVPPDDPQKGDPGLPEEPLPFVTDDKEVLALSVGIGEDGQEDFPIALEPPTDQLDLNINDTYLEPLGEIISINPAAAIQYIDTIYFSSSGIDQDEDGNTIIAYAWFSDIDGQIGVGYSANFYYPAEYLTPGIHQISLIVQDDEGEWSQPVSTTLTIIPTYRQYLPLINIDSGNPDWQLE